MAYKRILLVAASAVALAACTPTIRIERSTLSFTGGAGNRHAVASMLALRPSADRCRAAAPPLASRRGGCLETVEWVDQRARGVFAGRTRKVKSPKW